MACPSGPVASSSRKRGLFQANISDLTANPDRGHFLNQSETIGILNLELFLLSDFRFPLFIGIILLAVLFGLDVATTNIILLLGGYEQNAVMALIIHYPIIHLAIKGAVLGIITIIVQYCDSRFKGSGIYVLIPIILLYSFVIYNNTLVIRGLTGN